MNDLKGKTGRQAQYRSAINPSTAPHSDHVVLTNTSVLVVNTATKCGFTPQLEGLEKLYKQIKSSPNGADFEILGVPCNQFGGQNAEDDEGTQSFCQINYGVTFPILGKTDVNGDKAEPMFEWMSKALAFTHY